MGRNRTELGTLRRLLKEIALVLETTPELPENRTARCRELVGSALILTDSLLSQDKLPAAAVLGQKGGSQTAKRGPEYFRQLAAKRKTRGGGRPKKTAE